MLNRLKILLIEDDPEYVSLMNLYINEACGASLWVDLESARNLASGLYFRKKDWLQPCGVIPRLPASLTEAWEWPRAGICPEVPGGRGSAHRRARASLKRSPGTWIPRLQRRIIFSGMRRELRP